MANCKEQGHFMQNYEAYIDRAEHPVLTAIHPWLLGYSDFFCIIDCMDSALDQLSEGFLFNRSQVSTQELFWTRVF
jgi:hypothetical protein